MLTLDVIDKAREIGAVGIIGGGIRDSDLRDLLGYDLGVAITGTENIGLTVIVTEGFGPIAMARKTFGILSENNGKEASISGATQIRAGVLRPEIIIPESRIHEQTEESDNPGLIRRGTLARNSRTPFWSGRKSHGTTTRTANSRIRNPCARTRSRI